MLWLFFSIWMGNLCCKSKCLILCIYKQYVKYDIIVKMYNSYSDYKFFSGLILLNTKESGLEHSQSKKYLMNM